MKKKLLLLCIAACFSVSFNRHREIKRPNVLWITCEDMSPHLGSYGEKVAKTPNLDKLASEGVRYTQAFTTAGVCSPSRAAIITGQHQTSIGAHNMRTLQPESMKQFSSVKAYSAVPGEDTRCFPEYLRKAGYYCTNNEKQDYQFIAPVTVWDENSNTANWRGRKDGNQPFFSVINLMTTHESQIFSRDSEPLTVDPDKVEVPPYYPDTKTIRKDIARHLDNVQILDKQVGEIIQKLKDDGLYDDTIIFFFSDHGDGLPLVKREIYDRGLRVPLLVKFPKGYNAGSIDDQLISFVDLAPTMLSLAGLDIPAHFEGQAFLGEKKAKTPRKYIFAARDRMATDIDRVRAVGDGRFKYYRNYMPEKPYYQDIEYRKSIAGLREILSLRDAGKLNERQMYLFRSSKPEEELFDTESDPYEFKNLAGDPAYKAKLDELRKAHQDWERKYKDHGEIEESAMIKMWWGGDTVPVTASPEIRKKPKVVQISCVTPGASIGFKRSSKAKSWEVYDKGVTLSKGDSIYVQAHRIGYLPSKTLAIRID